MGEKSLVRVNNFSLTYCPLSWIFIDNKIIKTATVTVKSIYYVPSAFETTHLSFRLP